MSDQPGDPAQPQPLPPVSPRGRPQLVPNSLLAEALTEREERERLGLPSGEEEPLLVVVELNLRHAGGLRGAEERFAALFAETFERTRGVPLSIANTYYRCRLSVADTRRLAAEDAKAEPARRAIYRIWPDFPVEALVDRSVPTVKADAAQRSYNAMGDDVTWAVIDSGVDATHPHFRLHGNLEGDVADLHRDFTLDEEGAVKSALVDAFGHGTHVAGIIGGGLPAKLPRGVKLRVLQHQAGTDEGTADQLVAREGVEPQRLAGVAPRTKLVSLKALDDNGSGHSSNIIRALRYVREEVNGSGKLLRIHGVNLSVGYEFNARWFACGQSPMCVEVDKLVRSGVVVVVAAGNTGYGRLSAATRQTSAGLTLTINAPGNAELAITVGATHRDMPHTYGVSYFSSKGPTGDGRMKPDLVAPGERITSCAAGQRLADAGASAGVKEGDAVYVDDSGTSMAAPHVSGAIAAFLSIRREFIGQPERVKQLFCDSATSLQRSVAFQGRGLVDLMRAIQSV
ncbi:MAG: S8 family peptidase [Egibacteraceae bacterium]